MHRATHRCDATEFVLGEFATVGTKLSRARDTKNRAELLKPEVVL